MDTSYDAYRMLITTTIGHQLRNQKNCPIYTRIYCPDKSYSLSNHSRIACPVWPVIRIIGQSAPINFLEPDKQKAVFSPSGKLRVSLYKVLLFSKIADAIKSGALNVRHSYKYRSLDDYLIDKKSWQLEQNDYLNRSSLDCFSNCESTLKNLSKELDSQFHDTNRRIVSNENPYIRFRKDDSYILRTPKVDSEEQEPLTNYFPENRYISLLEVLATVNHLGNFLNEFQHWQLSHNKGRPPDRTFFAVIIGFGCFIGTNKMARISKLINQSELENTVNWYFSLSNIHAANDSVLRLMAELELPEVYRRKPGELHTSSDGQKYEVTVDSLNANYSFKYFGQKKGSTVYSFIDERHFLPYSNVISSSEKEAAYVIDGPHA